MQVKESSWKLTGKSTLNFEVFCVLTEKNPVPIWNGNLSCISLYLFLYHLEVMNEVAPFPLSKCSWKLSNVIVAIRTLLQRVNIKKHCGFINSSNHKGCVLYSPVGYISGNGTFRPNWDVAAYRPKRSVLILDVSPIISRTFWPLTKNRHQGQY